MRQIFTWHNFNKKVKRFTFILAALVLYSYSINANTRTWIRTGVLNNNLLTDLSAASNWSGSLLDDYVMTCHLPTKIIHNGKRFLVQATYNTSLPFLKINKSCSEKNVFSFAGPSVNYPVIYTNLLTPFQGTYALTDGVAAAFDNRFSAAVDDDDAQKLWNFDENIALVRGTSTLAIEFRPNPVLYDTLFYRLYLRQQPYILKFFTQYFNNMPTVNAWLIDKYLDTKTQINLQDTMLYNFSPNSDTISYRNRFMIVFERQLITNPVPVTRIANHANPNTTGAANSMAAVGNSVSVFPNPISAGGKAMLNFNNMQAGNYAIEIYNAKEQKLVDCIIPHKGGSNTYALPLQASLATGMYSIIIHNQNLQKTINLKLVVAK